MKILGLQFAFLLFFLGLGSQENIPKDYQDKLFQDPAHTTGPRTIPGRLEAVLYDLGGEGIAYHDVDSVNHGSGERPMFAIFAKAKVWTSPG